MMVCALVAVTALAAVPAYASPWGHFKKWKPSIIKNEQSAKVQAWQNATVKPSINQYQGPVHQSNSRGNDTLNNCTGNGSCPVEQNQRVGDKFDQENGVKLGGLFEQENNAAHLGNTSGSQVANSPVQDNDQTNTNVQEAIQPTDVDQTVFGNYARGWGG